jgi:Uma2 family endonuclease
MSVGTTTPAIESAEFPSAGVGLAAEIAGLGPLIKRWTVDEYHQLIERGVILEGAPIELLDGLLIYKDRGEGGRPMTYGPRNATCVRRLATLNDRIAPHGYHMRNQLPLTIAPDHEPEPDGAMIRGSYELYEARHPTPHECALVIEAADSSLDRDRRFKQAVYSRAGIPSYWIINLRNNTVEVYEQPDMERGEYRVRRDRQAGESIAILLPEGNAIPVQVDEILG